MASSKSLAADNPTHVVGRDGVKRPVLEQMSLQEFMALDWPEDQHWELIWGAPVLTPAPIPFHQDFLGELIYWMKGRLQSRPEFILLMDEDVLLPGSENYLRPDINIFRRADVDMAKVPVRVLPSLVVEILSPSTGGRDWGDKKIAFAEAGVPEYWIADPSTGALAIHVNPAKGNFEPQLMDTDGFLTSPFFNCRVRVHFNGKTYKVESRD
jgi:Uma2 family endonuclease